MKDLDAARYMLGVDIGTTSTKAVLYTETGTIVAEENNGYPLHTPTFLTAEEDPVEIFHAVLLSIGNVMRKSGIDAEALSFISFSSAMHSVIAMNKVDEPITKCITWADNRSRDWANKIKEELDGHDIYLKDRKSTRLNSSHVSISYAVFCLKKKKEQ